MDLSPEKLVLAPVRAGLKIVQYVGKAMIEGAHNTHLVERLVAEEEDTQLNMAAEDVDRAKKASDERLMLMQARMYAKVMARGLIRANNNLEKPSLEGRILFLKRIMVDDLENRMTFDNLLLDDDEIAILRQHLPDF